MSKKISDLDPVMQPRAQKAWQAMKDSEALKKLGVDDVIISETKRELATQMAYYSRKRMSVEDVKKMYKAAGLYDISDSEARTAVTWTLESKHLKGRAIDFVPLRLGRAWWNAPQEIWETMGEIGESCGLQWGGRWKNKDCPHFEM